MKRLKIVNDNAVIYGKDSINGDDLIDNLYEALGQYISTGKIVNSSHIAKVFDKELKAFEKKADDADNLSNIQSLMRVGREVSDYYLKKQAQDKDFSEYLLYKDLMKWQKDVWNDQSKRIALPAGRRSGKSYVIAALLIRHCLTGSDNIKDLKTGTVYRKERQAYYIGLTHERAAQTIWQPLKDLINKAHIPFSKIDNGSHIVTLSNGASIHVYGNNSKAEREKLRGIDASMFVIDEMQSQQGVAYLIESIIGPIVTGRDGYIILAGTAPTSAGTYWEEVMKGNEGYSIHKATMLDNTSIPNYEEALDEVLHTNNWTRDNISFRREYLGEIAYDTNRMIYPVRHYYQTVPKQKVRSVYVGVDYGFVDATAIACLVTLENGQSYLVNEFKERRLTATQIMDKINETVEWLSSTYSIDYDQIHVRTDNNEQNIVRDIQNRYPRMDIQYAVKRGETAQIALVNDMLMSQDLKIKENDPFDEECNRLVWKVSDNGVVEYGTIDDDTYHGDICDAVKYAVSSYYSDQSFKS